MNILEMSVSRYLIGSSDGVELLSATLVWFGLSRPLHWTLGLGCFKRGSLLYIVSGHVEIKYVSYEYYVYMYLCHHRIGLNGVKLSTTLCAPNIGLQSFKMDVRMDV